MLTGSVVLGELAIDGGDMVGWCSSVERKLFLHETAHSKVCGLSKHLSHDFWKEYFWLFELP